MNERLITFPSYEYDTGMKAIISLGALGFLCGASSSPNNEHDISHELTGKQTPDARHHTAGTISPAAYTWLSNIWSTIAYKLHRRDYNPWIRTYSSETHLAAGTTFVDAYSAITSCNSICRLRTTTRCMQCGAIWLFGIGIMHSCPIHHSLSFHRNRLLVAFFPRSIDASLADAALLPKHETQHRAWCSARL